MSSKSNNRTQSRSGDLFKVLVISFVATYAGYYFLMRNYESNKTIFEATFSVWAWASLFGGVAFIPYYQKYRLRNFPEKKGWLAKLDHSATCYVSGFILIVYGSVTAALFESFKLDLPAAGDFAVLVTAVTGAALCSDALLGITDKAGGHEMHFRPNLPLVCSVFALLSLALVMVMYCEIKHSIDTPAFSALFLVFCIISNFLAVHIFNENVDGIERKADPLFLQGFALIIIGALFSYGYTKLDTDLKSGVHVFAKYFFVSYTSAIGAVMLARSFEWDEPVDAGNAG